MMTTNLFVIANVKQLRTGGSFRILVPFFRTIFNSLHNRGEFDTILEGLRNFGGGFKPSPPPSVRHCVCTTAYFLSYQRPRLDSVEGSHLEFQMVYKFN